MQADKSRTIGHYVVGKLSLCLLNFCREIAWTRDIWKSENWYAHNYTRASGNKDLGKGQNQG